MLTAEELIITIISDLNKKKFADEMVDFLFDDISKCSSYFQISKLISYFPCDEDLFNTVIMIGNFNTLEHVIRYVLFKLNKKLKEFGWKVDLSVGNSKGVLYEDNVIRKKWEVYTGESRTLKETNYPNHLRVYWCINPI